MKLTRLAAAGILGVAIAIAPVVSMAAFNAKQTQEIQQIVHNYLVKNPEVLVQASEALQKQQMALMEVKAGEAIKANANDIFNSPNSPAAGNKDANVTVVEFFDYQCPHCKEMAPVISQLVKQDNLRVVYKELPIFGENSKYAAEMALAVNKVDGIDKFVSFHDALMAAANPLTNVRVQEIAKSQGLDVAKLEQAMKDNQAAIEAQLNDNIRLAKALQLVGTPSFVVANRSGSFERFVPGALPEAMMQDVIKQAQAAK